jgi:hypothetical protein
MYGSLKGNKNKQLLKYRMLVIDRYQSLNW